MDNKNNTKRKAPNLSPFRIIAEGDLIDLSELSDKVTEPDYVLDLPQTAIEKRRSLRSLTDPDTPQRKIIKGCKNK